MNYKILEGQKKSIFLLEPRVTNIEFEILQSIFWLSLELRLCNASKDMRRKLPSYPETVLFLTLVVFVPRRLHRRILKSHGYDCSDVIGQLGLRLPPSGGARLGWQC